MPGNDADERPLASPPPAPIRGQRRQPSTRRLRAYAIDPSLSTRLETAVVNLVTLKIPWEDNLVAGPCGEYLEVVDVDPASACYYDPVDLNDPYLLAEDGLPPSEGDPQFHQQMVYAVAMLTIRNFERSLGRRALWSERPPVAASSAETSAAVEASLPPEDRFVQRLRLYPHALRAANAYYSPEKKALLFGYFPAANLAPDRHFPGGMVFTCLSHDVIAHETTHALLDGMHRRFIEPSNPDVLAFHEAFADIVALFQHFTFPEVLRHQIAKTRGDLASQNLLAQLAQEFGEATGRYGALRDALGGYDRESGVWKPAVPDPTALDRVSEPHARGAILVAAVFDAFLSIYRSRIADLLRIATSGSGVLPLGQIAPDLVNRLADEAAKAAKHVLTMCIRALDYCPPFDVTFGEYLRALITADYDLVPDDERGYRVAVIEAFRRRGIYPRDVRVLSEESLRWQRPDELDDRTIPFMKDIDALLSGWDMTTNRRSIFERSLKAKEMVHRIISADLDGKSDLLLGLDVTSDLQADGMPAGTAEAMTQVQDAVVEPTQKQASLRFEVHSIRPARRIGPDGQELKDFIIELTQRRREMIDPNAPPTLTGDTKTDASALAAATFWFRGGCTLVIDARERKVRYAIIKKMQDRHRLARQRQFLTGGAMPSLKATYFTRLERDPAGEPFAFLHSPGVDEEETF